MLVGAIVATSVGTGVGAPAALPARATQTVPRSRIVIAVAAFAHAGVLVTDRIWTAPEKSARTENPADVITHDNM
jgi:hypothetical protein